MFRMTKLLAGAAGLAAVAAATPAAAQYYSYGYNPYAYNNQYGYNQYGYNNGYAPYAINASAAAQQCSAAVQNRLYTRNGLAGVLGSLMGAYGTTPRVLSITRVSPTRYGTVRVRGLASSGRNMAYGYGNGHNQADLSFRCDVDARGYVRDVDINRRY